MGVRKGAMTPPPPYDGATSPALLSFAGEGSQLGQM